MNFPINIVVDIMLFDTGKYMLIIRKIIYGAIGAAQILFIGYLWISGIMLAQSAAFGNPTLIRFWHTISFKDVDDFVTVVGNPAKIMDNA